MDEAVGQFELDGTPPSLRGFVDFDNAVSAGPAWLARSSLAPAYYNT
jgi:hypothetical protein